MIPIRTRVICEPMQITESMVRARLKEVEDQLKNNPSNVWKGNHYLIEERIQLRTYLGLDNEDRRPIGTPVSSDTNSHLTWEQRMKFEFEDKETITFGMVRDGQLFIGINGFLYQKSSDEYNQAWCLSDEKGDPMGAEHNFSDDEEIRKILPTLKKISF